MRLIMWLLLGIVLLVGTVTGARLVYDNSHPGPAADDQTGPAAVTPTEVFCLGFVDVEPGTLDLFAQQTGEVVELARTRNPDGTDRVFKKGEVLLRLDDQAAKATVSKANAALDEAKVKLDAAKRLPEKHALDLKLQGVAVTAAKAEKEKIGAEATARIGAFSLTGASKEHVTAAAAKAAALADEKIAAEQVKLDLLKLFRPQDDLDRAEADVRAKQGDLKLAEIALEKYTVKAPMDGTVLQVYAKVGELTGPQLQTPAVKFCPNTPRVVKAEVLQEWTHLVKVGQEVEIQDEAHKDRTWKGRVKSVSDFIGPKRHKIIEPFTYNDVRTMECVIEFASPAPVIIGQRVRVKIKLETAAHP